MTDVPADGARPLRVLESFRTPRTTTNPYLVLLARSLSAGAVVETFSWRRALAGRYDVLHVHWPEVVVERGDPVRALAASALFVAVLVRCRLARIPVVRTAHNLRPHEDQPWWTRFAVRRCDRWATWWIRLNETTPTPAGVPVSTIVHGHYRDWFADAAPAEPVPGRLLSFGLVRPYKGVEHLIDVVRGLDRSDVGLLVAGRPASAEVAVAVRRAAGADRRILLRLEHVPDADLAGEIRAAELVVLPYREMHNSGAVLLALSLDRPVLVPANAVTDALAEEVGAGWVQRFSAELGADDVETALDAVRSVRGLVPDLSRRDWGLLGEEHLEVFRKARVLARGRRGRPRWSGSSTDREAPGQPTADGADV